MVTATGARDVVGATLILLLTVTPLSAVIAPGQFEVRFRPSSAFDTGLTVALDDRTGLARGMAIAAVPFGLHEEVINHGQDGRMLIVTLDGTSCDYLTHLGLENVNGGFRITSQTSQSNCVLGTGMTRAVAVTLWSAVDASMVDFVLLH